MKLKKLLYGATIFLAFSSMVLSCNNNGVSRDKAIEFIKTHYTKTEAKMPTNYHVKWDFSSAVEGSPTAMYLKLTIIYFYTGSYENKLKDEIDIPYTKSAVKPIDENLPVNVDHLTYKFFIDGQKFRIQENTDFEKDKVSYHSVIVTEYNEEGYAYKERCQYNKYKFHEQPEVNGFVEATFTY